MTIYKGSQKVKQIAGKNKSVKRIYCGTKLIFGTQASKLLVYTTSGSITIPNNTISCIVHVVGSGGSSGGLNGYAHELHCASGGGSAGYSRKQYNSSLSGQTINFTVGQPISSYCQNGQNSSFLAQIGGMGFAGIAATGGASQPGGVGGAASGGDVNTNGSQGEQGCWLAWGGGSGGQGRGATGHTINGVQYGFGGTCTGVGSPTSGSGCVIVELIYWT